VCQLLATHCVVLSFALFALGGADPTGGFCLQILSFSKLIGIVGPIFDMVVISHNVEGVVGDE
jgi:hypothetical protein